METGFLCGRCLHSLWRGEFVERSDPLLCRAAAGIASIFQKASQCFEPDWTSHESVGLSPGSCVRAWSSLFDSGSETRKSGAQDSAERGLHPVVDGIHAWVVAQSG